jgi:protein phosphatase 1 regulatory subunit 7
LQSLTLHKLKIKQSTEFQLLANLSDLSISQSSLSEINGLSELKKLKTVSLRYFSKLENIEPLVKCGQLTGVQFQNCKKVVDWNNLENLSNLEILILENCGLINSIKWLKKIPIQKIYLIGDTNIQDGDMKWLLERQHIISLNFPVHKNYNLKPEELWAYQLEKKLKS